MNQSNQILLPEDVRKRAVEFSRLASGLARPHKSQAIFMKAFQECFETMVQLGMVKEEFINVEKEQN